MALLKEEESIPNFSEFQLSCSTPLNGRKEHISEPQIINEENNSHTILPEIHGEIPVYTAHCQSLKELNPSLMSETFDSESADMHETSHEISNFYSQNDLYDIQWRFHPNVWQMENGTKCLDFQHLNSGNTDPVNDGNFTGSPEISDSLEDDVSLCSSKSTFSSTQIAIEKPNGREENEESCNLCEEERIYNANTSSKTMEDEVLVPECLSNTGNYDLKCSSSVDQVSYRRTSEQNFEIQGHDKLGNSKRLRAGTTSSCTAQRNPVPPIQHARVEQSEQTMLSGGAILSSQRVMEGLVDHDDDITEKDVDAQLVETNFAVENNNENHHKLLRIRNNCTKVTKFCNSQPVVVHQLDPVEGGSRGYGGEERQVAVVKEIKSGEHQPSDKTAIDISWDKHGRKKSKKQTKENRDVPMNTLALRKAYDEKQRAETRKHIHRTPKKEEYKECVCEKISRNRSHRRRLRENIELPKIVSTDKIFKYKANKVANMPLKENLAIYNGPGRILVVKLESETCNQAFIDRMIHLDSLEKDGQLRTQPNQEESVNNEYNFECNEKYDLSALSSQEDERSQFQSTSMVDQMTPKQRAERQVHNENSYLEISRRLKGSLSSRNVFTRQSSVCNGGYAVTTSAMFHITSDTTPSNSSGTDSDDSSGKEFVRFPSIQMNNFVSQRCPRNAFSQGRIGMFRNRQVREKAVEIYRRRSEQLHQPSPRYTHHVKLPKLPAIIRRQTSNNSFRGPPSNKNARRR